MNFVLIISIIFQKASNLCVTIKFNEMNIIIYSTEAIRNLWESSSIITIFVLGIVIRGAITNVQYVGTTKKVFNKYKLHTLFDVKYSYRLHQVTLRYGIVKKGVIR